MLQRAIAMSNDQAMNQKQFAGEINLGSSNQIMSQGNQDQKYEEIIQLALEYGFDAE